MAEEKRGGSLIDKSIDFLFAPGMIKYLIFALILGTILRFIVANNVSVLADEMLHGPHAMNIISSGVINLQNQSPAWFYLTDIAYKLFGVNAIGGRFLSFFFGSLTILVIYLIGKELYNKKIAVISAILLAFSAFTIRYTLMEMDLAMIFFILFGFYFFVKKMREKNEISYLAIICLSVAVLIKAIAIPFLASFVFYIIYLSSRKTDRKVFLKKNTKRILISAGIILLVISPVLAYNIILYQQKGITDVLFSRFLKINPEIYSSLQGFDKDFSASYLVSDGIPFVFQSLIMHLDPLIFILGILGTILIFSRKEYAKGRPFALIHLLPLIFLMGTSLLQTHFVSFVPLMCLTGAIFIDFISTKFSKNNNSNKIIAGILLVVIIMNIFIIMPNLTSKSAIFKMRNYAVDNIGPRDIVVVDGRIYGGRIAWMFNDKSYLQSSYFGEFVKVNDNLSEKGVQTKVYFVECVIDDCGWGTIKDQPEFNASMEEYVRFFQSNAKLLETVNGGGGYGEETGKPYFNVYIGSMIVKPSMYQMIKQTHDWFYYPVRWEKNDWYDKYTPKGFFQVGLNSLGKLFLWLAVIFAIISPVLLVRELIKTNK